MEQIDLNDLPVYGVNVRDYGAQGNGDGDDAPGIQAALDTGRGLVVIPYGVYRIGRTLRVPSHTRLCVHARARLFLADGAGTDQDTFLLTNAQHERGDEDIHIEGGIWDGNNVHNPRGSDAPHSYTGVLLNLFHVRGLTLRSLTLRDPESYFVRLCRVTGFMVQDIRLEAPHLRPNQDGVHIGGFCEDGLVRDIVGVGPYTPNDDLVTLTADDANQRAQNLGKLCGPIRRIRVENLTATDCHTFVRLLSVNSPVRDVEVRNLRGGCHVAALNLDACRECRVPLFDPADPAVADGVGDMAGVYIRDVYVHKASASSRKPLVDLRTRVRDMVVENFTRAADCDAHPQAASLLVGQVGAAAVRLEGLTAAQIADLRQTCRSTAQRLAGVADAPQYAASADLGSGDALRLSAGGWARLIVNGHWQ